VDPVLEPAPTGRARCRACGEPIAKGELRLGDVFESPFAEDATTTQWYHPACAAHKRPDVVVAALQDRAERVDGGAALLATARQGVALRRLPRIDGAERAPTGRASCRACKKRIAKDAWRIRLVFFDQGRFDASGFVHATCAAAYFGTTDLVQRVLHWSHGLVDTDVAELTLALGGGP
jgi:hypothetical protein